MSNEPIPVLCLARERVDASFDRLEALLRPYLEAAGPGVILDLEDIAIINSTGLSRLVKLGMELDKQNRRFALARPERLVERTLRLIGLDRVMPVHKTVREAAGFLDAARDDQSMKG